MLLTDYCKSGGWQGQRKRQSDVRALLHRMSCCRYKIEITKEKNVIFSLTTGLEKTPQWLFLKNLFYKQLTCTGREVYFLQNIRKIIVH